MKGEVNTFEVGSNFQEKKKKSFGRARTWFLTTLIPLAISVSIANVPGSVIQGAYFIHWNMIWEFGLVWQFGILSRLFKKFFLIYLFGCTVLVVAGGLLSCGMRTLSCGMHVGSSSLTRDQSRAPCIGSAES